MKKISGNKNSDYQLKEQEKGMVHIRTTQRVHIPVEQRYDEITEVRKFHPLQHQKNIKNNFYDQYSKVEELHVPGDGNAEPKSVRDNIPELKDKYEVLYGEDAPKNIKKEELVKSIEEKEKEMMPSVIEDYKGLYPEEDVSKKTIYEMIEAIEKAFTE